LRADQSNELRLACPSQRFSYMTFAQYTRLPRLDPGTIS
jgi:hypothetical protein